MDMLKHPGMVDMPELLEKLDALRGEGKKIVFTNGCYDILHPGHVDLLERCKAQGDVLVLGLNSDESVKRQGKGDDRPSIRILCGPLCWRIWKTWISWSGSTRIRPRSSSKPYSQTCWSKAGTGPVDRHRRPGNGATARR